MNPVPQDTSAQSMPGASATPPSGLEMTSRQLGRRVLYFVLVMAISGMVGFAIAFVKIPLIVAGIIAALCVVLLFRNPYLGLLAYLLVYSLRIAEVYPVLAPLRMERVIGLATFGMLVLLQIYRRGGISFDASRQTRHFYFLIVAAFLTVPFAYWRVGAINGGVNFIKLLMFYLLIVHLVDTRTKLKVFVYAQCALVTYLALDSMLNYAHGALLHAQGIDRALGATSIAAGPNELGATMAATIPVFLCFALRKHAGPLKYWFLAGFGLLTVTLVMTGSRSALLGFIGAMSYFWWKSRHRLVLGVVGVILGAGMFIALPEQYQGRYSTITSGELDGSSMERVKVWTKGLKMFAEHPVTGVGVNCFGTANAYGYSSGPRASWLESHSLYVQVLAEMGVIGAFAFFSYMLSFFRLNRDAARKLADEGDEWEFELTLLNGMFAAFIALMFTGVFGHSLMRDTWYMYPALGLATLRIYLDSRAAQSESGRRTALPTPEWMRDARTATPGAAS